MKFIASFLLLTTSLPSLVAAQEISGGATLGFGKHNVSGISQDLSTATLDGRIKFAFNNGVTFGVSAGYLDLGVDGVPLDLSGAFVGFDLGYRFESGISLGAYVEQLTLDAGLGVDLSLKSAGVTAGYSMDKLEFSGFFGQTSTSPDLGGSVDIDNVGLTVKYAAMPNLNIAGSFLRASINAGGPDIDVNLFGVAATYKINDHFAVFGGVSRTSLDLANADFTTMGLGVSYDMTQAVGIASMVSLEVARTEISLGGGSEDLDTIRLGLTFPLGRKGTEAPLNSVADTIINPRHGAVTAAFAGAF